jgi:hypothetical protein
MEALRPGRRYDKELKSHEAPESLRDDLILANIIAFETFCKTIEDEPADLGIQP